jgi:hypothetical protein
MARRRVPALALRKAAGGHAAAEELAALIKAYVGGEKRDGTARLCVRTVCQVDGNKSSTKLSFERIALKLQRFFLRKRKAAKMN